jgi:hypothetical protein
MNPEELQRRLLELEAHQVVAMAQLEQIHALLRALLKTDLEQIAKLGELSEEQVLARTLSLADRERAKVHAEICADYEEVKKLRSSSGG